MKHFKRNTTVFKFLFILPGMVSFSANADFLILDDLIVDGSACIGFDCVNNTVFGFDTIRLQENNLRIKFQDTSTAASFPSNDWQLTANDSANGGQNKFSIDDITGGRTPFTVEAGAPNHSLYVDNGGRVGLGTSNPVIELHIVDGDTPSVRLEQDGSSGFAPQTWDVAGNETNFFIRDVTNGSQLPFRIRPGAPSNSIYVENTGDVAFGTTNNLAEHITILGNATESGIKLCTTSGDCATTGAGNGANFTLNNDNVFFTNREDGDLFFFTDNSQKLRLRANNNHELTGDLTISGQCTEVDGACAPDYVFEQDYDLMPLAKVAKFIQQNKHLPNVPKGSDLDAKGINIQKFSYTLLQKIEELTLYTLQQEEKNLQQAETNLQQAETNLQQAETIKRLQADIKKLAVQ